MLISSSDNKQSAVDKAEAKIREMILTGEWSPLQPIPTDKELALRLKVSRGTVIKSLKSLQNQGLIVGHQGKGRFVGRTVGHERTGVLGVLIADLSEIAHVVMTDRMAGIYSALAATDYHVKILAVNGRSGKRRSLRQIVDPRSVDGVVLFTQFLDVAEVEGLAKETRVVWVDAPVSLPGVATISLDFIGASFAAGRHLIGLGHKHIALATGSEALYPVLRRQRDGLRLAMSDLIDSGEGLLHCFGAEHFDESEGRRLGRLLLALNPRPTAVLCGSDELALGVYKEITASGLSVPGDISLISWSDTPVAREVPIQMTTVSVDYKEISLRAMEGLIHFIEGTDTRLVMDDIAPKLTVRESTAQVHTA